MPASVKRIDYPRIKPESVPELVEYDVAKTVYRGILDYFAQPGVQERFERWRKERMAAGKAGVENA